MRPTRFALLVVVTLALAACSGSTATIGPTLPAPSASASPIPVPVTSTAPSVPPAASGLPSASPTTLDPCVLIDASAASQLAGTTYTEGKEITMTGGGRGCDYGDGTTNVFHVVVAQAADEATAQAGKAEAEAAITEAAAKGVKFTEVPSIGDGCAYIVTPVTFEGATVHASAIYCLKGTVFFGFSDLALTATPTADVLQTTATNLLTQLP